LYSFISKTFTKSIHYARNYNERENNKWCAIPASNSLRQVRKTSSNTENVILHDKCSDGRKYWKAS
jgi:hypothetical protein